MSDEHTFSISRRAQLSTWITGQMLRGAGYAAALVIGFGLVLTLIWFVGTLLPEESRQTPDPNTWSRLAPATVTSVATGLA